MASAFRNTLNPAPNADTPLVLQHYNEAVLALDILYEVALLSEGAREELRAEAGRLVERAGKWRDVKHAFKESGK